MTMLHTVLDLRRRQDLARDKAEHPDFYEAFLHRMFAANERRIERLIDETLAAGALPGEFGVVMVFRKGDHGHVTPRIV